MTLLRSLSLCLKVKRGVLCPLLTLLSVSLSIVSFGQVDMFWMTTESSPITDNELGKNQAGKGENFYCNPLLLDGVSLDYNYFTLYSRGVLTIALGNPETCESLIPFYIELRRKGEIIRSSATAFLTKEMKRIEISEVLILCKPGDEIIIQPANKHHWKAKRILKLSDDDC